LREAIRKNLVILGQEKFDYVFIARNFIINMEFSKLLEDVQNAILKANKQNDEK
jgi:RNase P protein component